MLKRSISYSSINETMQYAIERITGTNQTITDFWLWAYSDVLTNTTRGVFAEYLVASALGITNVPRQEWDIVDLRYRNIGIEVKASSYIQSWYQNKHSKPVFSIRKVNILWDSKTNTSKTIPEGTRPADVYVFCLFSCQDKEAAKTAIIDVANWEFYVLKTTMIDEKLCNAKSVGLKRLQALTEPVTYDNLKGTVDQLLLIDKLILNPK